MQVQISLSAYLVCPKSTAQVLAIMEKAYKKAAEKHKALEVPQSQSPAQTLPSFMQLLAAWLNTLLLLPYLSA